MIKVLLPTKGSRSMAQPTSTEDTRSIFQRYYAKEPLSDRFAADPRNAVDVIIPIIHTNELWENNLHSFYREIPVKRLLIGDGGCIDNSLDVVKRFPRVELRDHRAFTSLGFSIRKLIEDVETDWFIYVHSDVYLPEGWFDVMVRHQAEYDWFGCPSRNTVQVDYPFVDKTRPYAGSQMGRKDAFRPGLSKIDDDFVYRQEDLVFANVVKQAGFREGRIDDTFHYHQIMHKESPWSRKIKRVTIDMDWSRSEEVRSCMTQVKGIIKYLNPDSLPQENLLFDGVILNIVRLMELDEITWPQLREWIVETNPAWLKHLSRWKIESTRLRRKRIVRRTVKNLLSALRCT